MWKSQWSCSLPSHTSLLNPSRFWQRSILQDSVSHKPALLLTLIIRNEGLRSEGQFISFYFTPTHLMSPRPNGGGVSQGRAAFVSQWLAPPAPFSWELAKRR